MKATIPVFLALILIILPAAAQTRQIPIVWPQPQRPQNVPSACFPAPRLDWIARFEMNIDKLKNGPYDLVFDGDSITDNWQGPGRDVWRQRYGALKAVDLGIGGDQVQHVTWRLQNGSLEGQNPKLIVVMIGTNNAGQDPKDVAAGIKMLLDEYKKRCPHAHILLLAVFPRDPSPTSVPRMWVGKVNEIISTYGDDRITYMDIGAKFLQPDGTLTSDMMPDFLHPTAKGYAIWADAIQPVVDKYVGGPAAK
ncbi:MAG: GDSL-type esterase/lipase family protein [Methylacidiphilales bacterium]|nr:GDSL-type esterase/lipase family protein [Candidatus Methylacidiphilales bacterium]